MENIIDRIRKIIKYQDISERAFCKEVGFSNGFLGKVNDIGSQKVRDILARYPLVSAEWLLLGEGPMLKPEEGNDTATCASCMEKDKRIADLTVKLLEAKDEIIRLKDDIIRLKDDIIHLKGGANTQHSAPYSSDVSDAVAG